ncbi:MAG: FkbM family methyltransferase [Candidatus Paceibacteria bacterium]|jgi:FkbM family methyltransferase
MFQCIKRRPYNKKINMLKKIVKNILNKLGLEIHKYTGFNSIDRARRKTVQLKDLYQNFLTLYFSKVNRKDFFFVEIGANDGISGDPLRDSILKYNLKGILIEPQTDVFEKLKKNYSESSNLQFANVAISTESGKQKFYRVKKEFIGKTKDDPDFFKMTAISSFNKENFIVYLKKRIPKSEDPNKYIEEVEIDAITLSDFTRKYDIKKIDLLQVDVEGYDHEIIKNFPYDKFLPSLINFESKAITPEQKKECENILESNGYKIFTHGSDTCAYRV